jgi:hypothetical protein
MTSRTRAVMTTLVAGILAFSGLPFHVAQRGYCARGAWEPATDDNPGVRRSSRPGDRVGCMLNATDGVGGVGEIDHSGSGDDLIDLALDIFASDLGVRFDVSITVFWIKERGAPNAFFHPGSFPSLRPYARFGKAAYDGTDGSVFLGTKLMRSELSDGRPHAFAAIIGHEFAHAMQARKKYPLDGKWCELHADYMAGYYVATRSHLADQAPVQSYLSLYKKGDYNFNDVGHHGTPKERGDAFEAGYRFGLSIAKNEHQGTKKLAGAAGAYQKGLTLMESLKNMEDAVRDRQN